MPNYPSNYFTNTIPECGVVVAANVNGGQGFSTQCVNIAQALDNSEYTVHLKESNDTLIQSYKVNLAKQPLFTADLITSTASKFPSFTSATVDSNNATPRALVNGKSLAVAWTMPSGLTPRLLNLNVSGLVEAAGFNLDKELSATATSALFAITTTGAGANTPNEASLWLEARDVFGRRFGMGQYSKIE